MQSWPRSSWAIFGAFWCLLHHNVFRWQTDHMFLVLGWYSGGIEFGAKLVHFCHFGASWPHPSFQHISIWSCSCPSNAWYACFSPIQLFWCSLTLFISSDDKVIMLLAKSCMIVIDLAELHFDAKLWVYNCTHSMLSVDGARLIETLHKGLRCEKDEMAGRWFILPCHFCPCPLSLELSLTY